MLLVRFVTVTQSDAVAETPGQYRSTIMFTSYYPESRLTKLHFRNLPTSFSVLP